jgi:hypothetical protein
MEWLTPGGWGAAGKQQVPRFARNDSLNVFQRLLRDYAAGYAVAGVS